MWFLICLVWCGRFLQLFLFVLDPQHCFRWYKPLDWVIFEIRGWAIVLHSQISCILCRRGPLLLRYACKEALETTKLQAPDSLSYHASFGARKIQEKLLHVLKFIDFPETQMIIFSNQCLFNSDSLLSRNMGQLSFVLLISLFRPANAALSLACGRLRAADCGGKAPDLEAWSSLVRLQAWILA